MDAQTYLLCQAWLGYSLSSHRWSAQAAWGTSGSLAKSWINSCKFDLHRKPSNQKKMTLGINFLFLNGNFCGLRLIFCKDIWKNKHIHKHTHVYTEIKLDSIFSLRLTWGMMLTFASCYFIPHFQSFSLMKLSGRTNLNIVLINQHLAIYNYMLRFKLLVTTFLIQNQDTYREAVVLSADLESTNLQFI